MPNRVENLIPFVAALVGATADGELDIILFILLLNLFYSIHTYLEL